MKTNFTQDEQRGLVPEFFYSGAKRFLAFAAAILLRSEGQKVSGVRQRNSRPRQKGFVNVPIKKARNFNFPH
ncbi:MAG: hypothetical protein QMD09_03335 [Desulfatibacillaceae bacterium]|nr:hypothetical protein [Desulfatibacillaceae bacterium]